VAFSLTSRSHDVYFAALLLPRTSLTYPRNNTREHTRQTIPITILHTSLPSSFIRRPHRLRHQTSPQRDPSLSQKISTSGHPSSAVTKARAAGVSAPISAPYTPNFLPAAFHAHHRWVATCDGNGALICGSVRSQDETILESIQGKGLDVVETRPRSGVRSRIALGIINSMTYPRAG